MYILNICSLYFKVQIIAITNHYYDFCLNKRLINTVVSKVVVKFKVLYRIRDIEYAHADMCFIITNKQPKCYNRHANKQLFNSETWSYTKNRY